jgi:surfeit locus 1 family protein
MPPSVRGLRFRPRWWGFALALAVCAATVSLGNWQTRRAEEKRGLAERFERAGRAAPAAVPAVPAPAEGLAFKRLAAKGEFVPRYTVLLDNKVYRGRAGYFVVTPLRISGSALHVLVNRGWIPGGARREDLPEVRTPAGEVSLEGYGLEHAPRVLAAGGGRPEGRVWQGLALDEFAQWSGLALQPVFLEQHSDTADGLVRDWPAPDFGIDKHTSYAMQWYLIAALSVAIFLTLSIERDRPPAG